MSRLRSINNADKLLKKYKFVVAKKSPCNFIDIGCGKGDFAISLANKYPKNNIIGYEKYATVLLKAAKKISTIIPKINNLKLICDDVLNIKKYILPNSLDCIFLNFSDPWPKKRHAKRRLTYHTFLDLYYELLKNNGILKIKTDSKELYEFSLEEITLHNKFHINCKTNNLYKSKFIKDNIQTEYEKKFILQKKKICFIEITKK